MDKQNVVDGLASQVNTVGIKELLEQAFEAGQAFERRRLQNAVAPSLSGLSSSIREADELLRSILENLPK